MTEIDFPSHQGAETWESLAKLTEVSNPLFDKTLFLMGYDFSSNLYLIQGEYHSLIDAGNDYTAFIHLRDLGIDLRDIKKVALTHGHPDHVMGVLELFRGYPGFQGMQVEVFLHEAGPTEFRKIVNIPGVRFIDLKGGETINLSGFDFEVIHTPGHTIDGLSFYHAPTGSLFSGDTVMPLAMADMDKGAGGNLGHYFYSLRTLLKRKIDHVMPGHGGVAPKIGRWVTEETYDGLIKKLVGFQASFMEGAGTLAEQGYLEEALFCVDKELAENADNLRALEFKAFLLNDLGRNEEALPVFDQLLDQPKIHPYLLVGKGCALLGLGRYEASLPLFDQVIAGHPEIQEAQVYKGMALYLSGRPEEALEIEAFRREYTDRLQKELTSKSEAKT
jgi:glyoxylase-like metal-dependent hydrolase (beta-lactamase superfamily II)